MGIPQAANLLHGLLELFNSLASAQSLRREIEKKYDAD
jgi:hypothetical protein